MVRGLHHPKNISLYSNMKSPKSNGKSRKNRYCIFKDQPIRSPNKSIDVEIAPQAAKLKVKSGTWSSLQFNTADTKQAPLSSSSISHPGILYSDVLFSGENPNNAKTLVTIRNQEPNQSSSFQTHSQTRKRIIQKYKKMRYNNEGISSNQTNAYIEPISVDKKATELNSTHTHIISTDLREYTKYLGNHLNVEIPSWNFTDIETFDGFPKFTCQFDDYNYLTCERVALVGLRLASDGKFKS